MEEPIDKGKVRGGAWIHCLEVDAYGFHEGAHVSEDAVGFGRVSLFVGLVCDFYDVVFDERREQEPVPVMEAPVYLCVKPCIATHARRKMRLRLHAHAGAVCAAGIKRGNVTCVLWNTAICRWSWYTGAFL